MDTKMATAKYRASQWMEIIRDRQDSGLNIKQYCQERGISRHAYFYWQRKLREATCSDLITQEGALAKVPDGWTQLVPTIAPGSSLTIEISGCRIDVDGNTDLKLLKNVCHSLRIL